MIKTIFLLYMLFGTITFANEVKYTEFVDAQIEIAQQMSESNITQQKIESLLEVQNSMYEAALNTIMRDKNSYTSDINLYENEIFALNKIILINKRAGNTYAVIRDEVEVKSYLVVRAQAILIRDVLKALDAPSLDDFHLRIEDCITQNRRSIAELYTQKYDDIIGIDTESRTLQAAKKNIDEFLLLEDVNEAMINYLSKYENKMYRLNKFSKYHLIGVAIYINSIPLVQDVNSILEEYNFSIVKLLFIFALVIVIYFFRKIVYVALENYILKIDALKKYSTQILAVLKKPIEMLILIINLNMIIYVYDNFSSVEVMSRAFNIIYGVFFTYMLYKVLNTIASIKLYDVVGQEAKMKNDLINVGIKIINFIILLIGFLVVLYFAGVDLTAVLSGLGIGGFAVAFAAKDTISNFFGTISILFSDVFSQGDWVAIDGHEGVVVEIGLRVTTIRTFDNALIAIPNGTFASTDVKNWNKRTLGRRIKMSIGVKYDSKPSDLKNAVNEIRGMLDKHPKIATINTKHEHRAATMAKLVSKDDLEGVKKNLFVHLDDFGPSSINILIYCFTKSVVWGEWLETKEEVMLKIMAILEKHSLEFAFPSLSLYNEN